MMSSPSHSEPGSDARRDRRPAGRSSRRADVRHGNPNPDPRRPDRGRLNLLISYGGWRTAPAVEQLGRLLEPLGISSFRADSGEEAAEIIRAEQIHIALVDLTIPLHRPGQGGGAVPGGGRILQLLRRLQPAPPTVIVRPPQPAARENARGLSEALREGAFAVVDRPFHLETMLEVMRRVVSRYYADTWPDAGLDHPHAAPPSDRPRRRRPR